MDSLEKLPITVMIMTQNEEMNIKYALDSVIRDFNQVIVTDSFSTDATKEICKGYPVDYYEHKFEGWAEQRNWMLEKCETKNDVVFFLDADEYVNRPFIMELKDIVKKGMEYDSIYLIRKHVFLGRSLRFAHGHPPMKRIFKKNGLWFYGEGAREYSGVEGRSIRMNVPYIHHDRKPVSCWIDKHNSNSTREALLFVNKQNQLPPKFYSGLPFRQKIKLTLKRYVYDNMPLFFRPFMYFVYRYFFRLGFLDGRAGLIYCYLHAFWYHSLIGIKAYEQKVCQALSCEGFIK